MGAYKYYNPSTQQWEIVKSKSIIKPDGSLEYTPDDIKNIDDKVGGLENDFNVHQADYEYQVPTIVDRQIQIVKQSNTNRLVFKLNTDIATGTVITISLDGGSTSKPLKDFEGVDILELEKGFMEVIADATFFTLRSRGGKLKQLETPMLLLKESEAYDSGIGAVSFDGLHLYVGSIIVGTNRAIQKRDINTMNVLAESPTTGMVITTILVDDDFVYVSGTLTEGQKIKKYNKSDLTFVGESTAYTGNVFGMVADDTYIYIGGATSQKVRKYRKSDLGYVGQTVDYGGEIRTIKVDDTSIYVGGKTGRKIKKYDKSTLTFQAESVMFGAEIYASLLDEDYIYVGNSGRVSKLNKSDLSKVADGQDFSGLVWALGEDQNNIYQPASTSGEIRKINKETLSLVTETQGLGSSINGIVSTGNHIFAVGGFNDIKKINSKAYESKGLILLPFKEV